LIAQDGKLAVDYGTCIMAVIAQVHSLRSVLKCRVHLPIGLLRLLLDIPQLGGVALRLGAQVGHCGLIEFLLARGMQVDDADEVCTSL